MLNKIRFKEKPTLSQSCSLLVATIVLITGLMLSFISWSNLNKQLHTTHLNSAQQQLQRLAIAIAPSLLLQDRISLNITLQEWTKASDINFIRVLNNSHQAIAEAGQHLTIATEISQHIAQDNLSIGTIKGEVNFNKKNKITSRHLALGLTITAFFTLLSALATYFICEHYFNYLRQLILNLNLWRLDKSQLLALPSAPSLPELSDLHQAVTDLSKHQQIQSAFDEASRQFGLSQPTTAKNLEYRTCSLLFIQIQNFEELQSELSTQALTELLNRYYQLLQQACKLYGGRIEPYAGNGALALFGLHTQDPQQAAMHAIYSAQLFLGIIKHKREQNDSAFIDFRLACHWGDVLLTPQTNTAGQQQFFGDNLHWGSLLASNSDGSRLLISQSLFDKIGDNKQADWLPGNPITGLFGQPEDTWWLSSLEQKQQALIQRQIRHIATIL